jgi:hypothetical protein
MFTTMLNINNTNPKRSYIAVLPPASCLLFQGETMMYCPNCATPIDNVKFCRSCGTNVSLIPQALTGELPVTADDGSARRGGGQAGQKELNIEEAVTTFFTGLGFLIASLAVTFYVPKGVFWGWALLIPAFACIGHCIGKVLQYKERRDQQRFEPAYRAPEITAPTTSELDTPASVTEHTTKQLDK